MRRPKFVPNLRCAGDLRPVKSRCGAALLLMGRILAIYSIGPGTLALAQLSAPSNSELAVPEFKDVKALAEQHFAGLEGREPGDLITQQDVAPLFPKLKFLGWDVAEKQRILALILSKNDPLVKALRSAEGKKLMRRLSGLPEVYDRMDRLRAMPYGMRRIHEMIEGPDGYKLFEYMVTTPGGHNLGVQLSQAKNGSDFNQPTGRLYTAEDVLERLEATYNAQFDKKPRTKNKTRQPPTK